MGPDVRRPGHRSTGAVLGHHQQGIAVYLRQDFGMPLCLNPVVSKESRPLRSGAGEYRVIGLLDGYNAALWHLYSVVIR